MKRRKSVMPGSNERTRNTGSRRSGPLGESWPLVRMCIVRLVTNGQSSRRETLCKKNSSSSTVFVDVKTHDYTSSNTLTSDGLLNQITKLEFLAHEAGQDRARVCRVLAQNYQLAGSLARDRFQHRTAREYFRKALQVLDVDEFPDMAATAIARHALVYLRQDRVDKALALYEGAVTIADHAEPFVRAYVLSGLAEVYARNQEKDSCYRLLDQAEEYLSRVQHVPIEEDFAYVCPTLQSLEDERGECYVLLGEVEKGLHYLQTAQQQLDQKISRNRCRLFMQHAEAFFVANQPDQCVASTLEGLQVARAMESVSNINWACEMYTKLCSSDWKKEQAVKSLREALRE